MTLGETIRINLGAVWARARVRVVASWREKSWVVGETIFPFLAMSAFSARPVIARSASARRRASGPGTP